MDFGKCSKSAHEYCSCLSSVFFTLFSSSPCFSPCILWTNLAKGYGAPKLGSSWIWASNSFAMNYIQFSLILGLFWWSNKNTKTYTIWSKLIARVLNMLIGLKGNNYYSKVFKRINYKLWNSTFWVVITKYTYYPFFMIMIWILVWHFRIIKVLKSP